AGVWIGRRSVPKNVVPPASSDDHPALRNIAMSDGSRLPKPAMMSNAASAGIAMNDTRPETVTPIRAIHNPPKIDAQRVSAPERTLIAVALSEPPTGRPL